MAVQGGLRIAALCVWDSPHARYRVMLPLRELQRQGHRVRWNLRREEIGELIESGQLDVLLIHHFFAEETLALVERCARLGVAAVWDKDDDLRATPRWAPAYKAYGRRRGIKKGFARSVAVAATASLMTTPSAQLAEIYREQGVEHVEVLENYLAPEDVAASRPRHQGLVIGITAGGEHAADIEGLRIDRTLTRLLQRHPGVRVVSVGCKHDLPEERHVHHPSLPVEQLIPAEREFDIGLAPLLDSAINRARSDVKLKEYAAAGAMWLASPVGPYVGYGEEQGGLLVADDGWEDVLEELIVDYRRRSALIEAARAWARGQTIDRAAGRWRSAFARAVERARAAAAVVPTRA